MKKKRRQTCCYCGRRTILAKDHVLAKCFLPNEQKYRRDPILVPSCNECNQNKSKIEQITAVYFQFGHGDYASEHMLKNRVPKMLRKNKKLADAISMGLHKRWAKHSSGLVLPELVLEFPHETLLIFRKWFEYVVRGLHRHELKRRVPLEHTIYFMNPLERDEVTIPFREWVRSQASHKTGSLANKEFHYEFAVNHKERLTMWVVLFKSIEVVGVTSPRKKNFKGGLHWL